jgi:NAD(P)-dependent dehydrogenase (short-subunit alcohol dehydrogenase family)
MSAAALAGKCAVVSGGASGIGLATGLLFAQNGAQVALLDIQAEAGTQALKALQAAGAGQALFFQTDMTAWEPVELARERILESWGQIDIWINVAGGSGRRYGDGPTAECSLEGWESTLELNLKSTFLGCKAALQAMLPRRQGAIVNIASVLGLVGGDADFATHAYAASKGGVISLTRSIAAYYADQGLRANVICPGLIATPMSQRAQASQAIRQRLAELQPLTGDFGLPEDVAQAALYLASDQARFVTGAVLTVDGGWTAR